MDYYYGSAAAAAAGQDPVPDPVSPDSTLLLSAAANKRRGIFPKAATNTMRNWLFKHLTVRAVGDTTVK